MTSKQTVLAVAAAVALGCIGAAQAGTDGKTHDGKPELCTNDRSKVDETRIYSAECPSVSAVRRPDGTWVPANDGPGKVPASTEGPAGPPDATGEPTAPDMGSGNNY